MGIQGAILKKKIRDMVKYVPLIFALCVCCAADSSVAGQPEWGYPKAKDTVHFGIAHSFPETPSQLASYLLNNSRKKFTHLKTYLGQKGYSRDQLTNDILASLSRAIRDHVSAALDFPTGIDPFETWIQDYLKAERGLSPLRGEIVVIFNVHSNENFRLIVDLFDRIREEKKNPKVIWTLEDALLFEDLITAMVTGDLDPHSESMTWILEKRLKEDPAHRLAEMSRLRIPIERKRTNYIPRLPETPRVDFLMQHPEIGMTLESLNDELTVEDVRSILMGAAFKWKAFAALINEEDEDQFFRHMLESIRYYLTSQIYSRDQIFAKQLFHLRKNHPSALIFTDRGLDHIDSLMAQLERQEFQETPVTVYYPAAYRNESYSYLQWEPLISRLEQEPLSADEKSKLMTALKRFALHEILARAMFSYFSSNSFLAISNVAQDAVESMSQKDIDRMLYVIQRENKKRTYKAKRKVKGKEILNWFIQQESISSLNDIREKINAQPTGYIKVTLRQGRHRSEEGIGN